MIVYDKVVLFVNKGLTDSHYRRKKQPPFLEFSPHKSPLPQPFSDVRSSRSQPKHPQIHSSALEARVAQLRLCADGGANLVYDEMPLLFPQEDASDVRRKFLFFSFSYIL
ncbi:thiamine pyrophosphokinase 1-like [Durio zibethinus]|uniref:Thiamine pyrophosphokinase 1-like n=1 Tax=Durio zibethinus TaxID=66656 RepID=A0A6P6B191_DURZI|nr:thiamine pyrophosphokinase 1-like [Durio zibethinus]